MIRCKRIQDMKWTFDSISREIKRYAENEELLKKFNIFGSQHKGWLPPSYGKKMYHDMQKEEQQIVDAFEGEKAYETVVKNREYYFSATENMLMLE